MTVDAPDFIPDAPAAPSAPPISASASPRVAAPDFIPDHAPSVATTAPDFIPDAPTQSAPAPTPQHLPPATQANGAPSVFEQVNRLQNGKPQFTPQETAPGGALDDRGVIHKAWDAGIGAVKNTIETPSSYTVVGAPGNAWDGAKQGWSGPAPTPQDPRHIAPSPGTPSPPQAPMSIDDLLKQEGQKNWEKGGGANPYADRSKWAQGADNAPLDPANTIDADPDGKLWHTINTSKDPDEVFNAKVQLYRQLRQSNLSYDNARTIQALYDGKYDTPDAQEQLRESANAMQLSTNEAIANAAKVRFQKIVAPAQPFNPYHAEEAALNQAGQQQHSVGAAIGNAAGMIVAPETIALTAATAGLGDIPIAAGVGTLASKVLPAGVAKVAGNVAAGAVGGAAFNTGATVVNDASEGRAPTGSELATSAATGAIGGGVPAGISTIAEIAPAVQKAMAGLPPTQQAVVRVAQGFGSTAASVVAANYAARKMEGKPYTQQDLISDIASSIPMHVGSGGAIHDLVSQPQAATPVAPDVAAKAVEILHQNPHLTGPQAIEAAKAQLATDAANKAVPSQQHIATFAPDQKAAAAKVATDNNGTVITDGLNGNHHVVTKPAEAAPATPTPAPSPEAPTPAPEAQRPATPPQEAPKAQPAAAETPPATPPSPTVEPKGAAPAPETPAAAPPPPTANTAAPTAPDFIPDHTETPLESGQPAPVAPNDRAEASAKEPWQMTRQEHHQSDAALSAEQRRYSDQINETRGMAGGDSINPPSREAIAAAQMRLKKFSDASNRSHMDAVEQALNEGKPVPAEVLKDYPDLVTRISNEMGIKGSLKTRIRGILDAQAKSAEGKETAPAASTTPTGGGAESSDKVQPTASDKSALINRIIDASRSPLPPIVARNEIKGTDGKWYRGDLPTGVSSTGEVRSGGFAFQANNGSTYGVREPTREALIARHNAAEDSKAKGLRNELEKMPPERLREQAKYWLKEEAPTAKMAEEKTATPAPTKAPPPKARQTKGTMDASQVSDFEPGRDKVVREGGRTFIHDTRGERADLSVKSDAINDGVRENIKKLNPAQLDKMRDVVATTPYLSDEGKRERLDYIKSIQFSLPAAGAKLGEEVVNPPDRTDQTEQGERNDDGPTHEVSKTPEREGVDKKLASQYRADESNNDTERLFAVRRASAEDYTPDEQVKKETTNNAASPPINGAGGEQERLLPKPEESGKPETTGIKNAVSERDRERLGLPKRTTPDGRSFDEMYDSGKAAIAADPMAEGRLINQLRANPEKIVGTKEEAGILLKHKVDLENELQRLRKNLTDAESKGDETATNDARMELEVHRAAIKEFTELAERTGTATGRALAARKMMSAMDYSLSHMESMAEASKGSKLTPEELQKIGQQHDEIKAKNVVLQTALDAANERAANAEAERDHANLLREAAEKAAKKRVQLVDPAAPKVTAQRANAKEYGAKNRLFTRESYEKAKRELLDSNVTYSGLPLDKLAALAKIGAFHIEAATHSLADFSAKMIADLGDKLSPDTRKHMQEIYDASKKEFAEKQNKDLIEKMRARKAEGATADEMQPYLRKLALELINGGIKKREPLLDALHENVKEVFPDITRNEVRDTLSGYGDYKQLNKDADQVTLRDINQQSQKLAQLEALEKGKAPEKTGVERQSPNDETRALTKQVNEAKKRAGIITTDPATQLKTTLDSMKTRARNTINDLQAEIDTKQRIVKGKTVPISDPELDALRKQVADLRKSHAEVFGKPGMTDEQRLAAATKTAQSNWESWLLRLDAAKRGNFDQPKAGQKITGPELDALRTKTDTAKREYEQLEKAANPPKSASERREEALQKQIAALSDRIDMEQGERPQKQGPPKPVSAEVDRLTRQRDIMQKQLAYIRENDPVLQSRKAMQAATKTAQEYERKGREGEFTAGPDEPKLELSSDAAMAKWTAERAKEKYEGLRNADPEYRRQQNERMNQAYRTRLAQQLADLKDRMARGDYGPRPPKPGAILDKDSEKAKAGVARVKAEFANKLHAWEQKNQPRWIKTINFMSKWPRLSVLSGTNILIKLPMATMWNLAAKPMYEVAGSALSRLPGISRVSDMAPSEHGGFSPKAYAHAIGSMFTTGMKGAYDKLFTRAHQSNLDLVYGKGGLPPDAMEMFGWLHGALKEPVKQFEWKYSFEKRIEGAIMQGVDVTDPVIQTEAGLGAYMDAKRSIFQEKNILTDAFHAGISSLERSQNSSGDPSVTGRVSAAALRGSMPVVGVPVNMVKQTFEHALGLPVGLAEVARAWSKGIDNLKPQQSDDIMRHLKRGSVGAAVALLALYAPNMFGGYFQRGQKKKEGEVPEGTANVGGVEIPRVFLHHPLVEVAQLFSTAARVANSRLHAKDTESQGKVAGAMAAGLGLLEQLPFARQAEDVAKMFDPMQRQRAIGDTARSLLVPQIIQQAAKARDEKDSAGNPVARKPRTIAQNIEMGIPGLRKNVPRKGY